MTIGPAHNYIDEGRKLGIPKSKLLDIHNSSLRQKSNNQIYIHSLGHLCHLTSANYVYLQRVIRRTVNCYDNYEIPKRSGGNRFISAPTETLKKVQQWINRFVLSNNRPHWRCYSYHSEASIYKCAKEHCNSKWLIKLDIENFFESVSEVSVYDVFKDLGYSPLMAFELARICTIDKKNVKKPLRSKWMNFNSNSTDLPYPRKDVKYFGRLPQGAPTSPQISNLVFKKIDQIFQSFSENEGLSYTRYADDICFSSGSNKYSRIDALRLIRFCSKELRVQGYTTNKLKTKIIPPGANKIVMGLNVSHSKPKLSKDFKKRVERHVRGIEKFGIIPHASHIKFGSVFSMLNHVTGLINHAICIEPEFALNLKKQLNTQMLKQGFI